MHILSRGVVAAIFSVVAAVPAFADPLYTFIPIAVPGSSQGSTIPYGVNDGGEIVGSFQTAPNAQHGFLDIGGVFSQFDAPGAVGSTVLTGINKTGQISGTYFDGTNEVPLILSGGSLITITVTGTYGGAYAAGINAAGEVVGEFDAAAGPPHYAHGFLDAGGIITQIDVPGALSTSAFGINDAGEIVGYFENVGSNISNGFLDD